MEFAFDEDPGFCSWVLRQCKALDYWPVIAHPERYYFVQNDPDIAFDWCVEGFPLQLNKGSILGRFGPDPLRCSHQLLQHGLAACVASDAHSPRQRSTFMGEIQDYLMENFGTDYCRLLLEENPSRILSGRELLGYEPIPF